LISEISNLHESLPNEKILFLRLSEGDENAFVQIFHHYSKRIFLFVLKKTKSETIAEEIVQEIFLKLWENKHQLNDIENYQSYIFTMAVNRVYNYFRKTANNKKVIESLWLQIAESKNTTDDFMLQKEYEIIIQEAVENLPPQRKAIYLMSRQQNLSHAQIALKLNIAPSTVNNQLTEALRSIRKRLPKSLFFMLMFW
jgi:RNA polymerase sigma-70 factor (ECF subfamily)